ncbi:ferritin family protein [Saccharicrinis sp. FJH2]|uniref:ferritin-like domain-containing protein n=1 Tax=Saccharicrinis sp. FJH65 TaxID=3344659 RepID=UPI0035F2387A
MSKSVTDILKEAILLEMRGQSFYSNVSEKSDNEAAKEFFDLMAKEEGEHIRFLKEQFDNYTKNAKFTAPKKIDTDDDTVTQILTDKIKKEISAASFEAAAISAAMDFETRAVKIYADRAKEATDPEEQKTYDMLAKWEVGHQKFLHEINEELKERVWYDNQFWAF